MHILFLQRHQLIILTWASAGKATMSVALTLRFSWTIRVRDARHSTKISPFYAFIIGVLAVTFNNRHFKWHQ